MRTASNLRASARAAGLSLDTIERVPVAGGGTALATSMTFEDPWAAARLLFDLAEEDAGDPIVRAWSLEILAATADWLGIPLGPTIGPELSDAYVRALHANVQAHIRFVHEPVETFQSARVTMQTGAGDCDDHARLLYALAVAGNRGAKLVFFEEDGQPVHVVAMLEDADGSWQWAETTIDAEYGEQPHDALARLDLGADANPMSHTSMGAAAAPATVSHNFATPIDVLQYRRIWDGYVVGTAQAAIACAERLEAQAAAGAGNADDLRLAADTERTNAEALMLRWNLHADTPDYQILINAGDILVDQQDAVLKAGQTYQAQIRTDCPAMVLPEPPTLAVQSRIIGAIEGLGILGHGVLQLLGAGVGGALDTLGAIGSPGAMSTVTTIAIAAAVVAAALALREVARDARR